MEYIYAIMVALPLGLVSYSIAFWGGVYRCLCFQEVVKMTIVFAFFQTGMFWLGSWSGNIFASSMGWLSIPFAEAIVLLSGVKLIYGAIRLRPEQKTFNLSKNGELVAVSFAASMNAFLLGLGIGLLMPVPETMLYAILAGVVIFAISGNYTGKHSGLIFYPKFAGIVGGAVVIALAVILAFDLYNMI